MWSSNPTGGMRRGMFNPNFLYTDKIVGDLAQIIAARELVLNSAEAQAFDPVIDELEVKSKFFPDITRVDVSHL